MLETPAQFNEANARHPRQKQAHRAHDTTCYPMEKLARYRFHTGATVRPLAPDELCPVLFRDIGSVAIAEFLQGTLTRLAGPYIPITYMRTEHYREPYTDYAQIGRLLFLRPLEVHPWHSGNPHIYIARATRMTSPETLAYIPGDITLAEASRLATDVPDIATLRDVLGGTHYDQRCQHALQQLHALNHTLARTEQLALPLRRMLQSPRSDDTRRARELMARHNIDESDLCAAWHHIPEDKRGFLEEAFLQLAL